MRGGVVAGVPTTGFRHEFLHSETMNKARIARLSEAQRACLRRVLAHQTSKDIARELGISPHTVDQRLRVAAKTLGVAGRIEAAKLLAAHEQDVPDAYQPLIYQSSAIAPEDDISVSPPWTAGDQSTGQREFGDTARERQLSYQSFVPEPQRSIALPFPFGLSEENKLGIGSRLGWIVMIAIAAALSFGAILAGLESLGSLFRDHAARPPVEGALRSRS